MIKIKFARRDCEPCPSRARCTAARDHRRTITIRNQLSYTLRSNTPVSGKKRRLLGHLCPAVWH
ncbi:MAG: hypothetical protein FJ147_24285 [Deltaproteobacteria bacterium]|nr:hypothetical protein [Deltaproteobacteria bacterium]